MVSVDEFKELFEMIPHEPEFEICFEGNPSKYMIIKYEDHVTFQRCGLKGGSGEIEYEDVEKLFQAKLIDDIQLARDWQNIVTIIVNSSWDLCLPDDIEHLKNTYLSA